MDRAGRDQRDAARAADTDVISRLAAAELVKGPRRPLPTTTEQAVGVDEDDSGPATPAVSRRAPS